MRGMILLLCAGILTPQLGAQGLPPGERMLLPVFTEQVPGAFGSLWRSELWVYNDNLESAGVGLVGDVPAKSTSGPVLGQRPTGATPGAVMTALPHLAAGLSFNLRVRDLSRSAESFGTEIPVVRESEFFTSKVTLLNVPTDSRFRPMLRVYQFLGFLQPPATVRVRFYRTGQTPDLLLEQLTLSLEGSGALAYAQLSSLPLDSISDPTVRVEIESIGSMRFWAFVSITNNETQHVTIITPQ